MNDNAVQIYNYAKNNILIKAAEFLLPGRGFIKSIFKWIIAAVLVGSIWYGYVLVTAPTPYSTGEDKIVIAEEPYQSSDFEAENIVLRFDENIVTLEPQAEYEVSALILSRKNYYFEFGAKVMPTDLALGWGDMGDPEKNQGIKVTQSGRWYYFNYDNNATLKGRYMATHSSNHHTIPASDEIKKAIGRTKKGQLIRLSGYLVDITTEGENFDRKSSTTRTDTGAGSCEIMYVLEVQIEDKKYK